MRSSPLVPALVVLLTSSARVQPALAGPINFGYTTEYDNRGSSLSSATPFSMGSAWTSFRGRGGGIEGARAQPANVGAYLTAVAAGTNPYLSAYISVSALDWLTISGGGPGDYEGLLRVTLGVEAEYEYPLNAGMLRLTLGSNGQRPVDLFCGIPDSYNNGSCNFGGDGLTVKASGVAEIPFYYGAEMPFWIELGLTLGAYGPGVTAAIFAWNSAKVTGVEVIDPTTGLAVDGFTIASSSGFDYNSVNAPPEPVPDLGSTLILLGMSLIGLRAYRR